MNPLRKYAWLIEAIRRAGKISLKDLSDKWERNFNLSDGKPLSRATFNNWREAIDEQFNIRIGCQKVCGYYYYIENPEDIDEDKLKKWMLDSFTVGNVISENLSLKGRILVDEIPSGREHLTALLDAMKESRVVSIVYRQFGYRHSYSFPIEPYCVKLFENRWYVLGRNNFGDIKVYGLDRIESAELTDEHFHLPPGFDAEDVFATAYGVSIGFNVRPEKIVLRAYDNHRFYLKSLPLHHSQRLIEEHDTYADFELELSPTFDFIMKLLQAGSLIEVIRPATLRAAMKARIAEMAALYARD